MTLAAAQAELALLNGAIATILAGGVSSYSVNGRSVMKLSLKDLTEQRRELENLIARLGNGMFSVVQFRDPE